MDNLSFHANKKSSDLFKANNIEAVRLIAYNSDLNSIEFLFKFVKEKYKIMLT